MGKPVIRIHANGAGARPPDFGAGGPQHQTDRKRNLTYLGIAGPAPAGQALQAQTLFSDTLHVVCRSESAFARSKGDLTWEDLARTRLIANEALSAANVPKAASVVSRSMLSVRNILSLLAMVDCGVGITVLPGLATRSLPPTLRAVPLKGEDSVRPISLLSRSGRTESPLAQAFRSYLTAALPEVSRRLRLILAD